MSSEKQTDSGGNRETSAPPIHPKLVASLVGGTLLVFGWALILHINRWHFTPPVLFLLLGWVAVLLTARYLWDAGWTAATEPQTESDEEFWQPVGAREELEAEKKALVRAIKEIEFDREMGKMSDEDAAELTRYYRIRAIEVIKALELADESEDRAGLPVAQLIERDVEARLELKKASSSKKKKKSKKAKKPGEEKRA